MYPKNIGPNQAPWRSPSRGNHRTTSPRFRFSVTSANVGRRFGRFNALEIGHRHRHAGSIANRDHPETLQPLRLDEVDDLDDARVGRRRRRFYELKQAQGGTAFDVQADVRDAGISAIRPRTAASAAVDQAGSTLSAANARSVSSNPSEIMNSLSTALSAWEIDP